MKWNQIPFKKRRLIKLELAARDGLICCICRLKIRSLEEATIEHKRKQRNHGTHDLANLGLAHAACNFADRHPDFTDASRRIETVTDDGFF